MRSEDSEQASQVTVQVYRGARGSLKPGNLCSFVSVNWSKIAVFCVMDPPKVSMLFSAGTLFQFL